MDFKKSFTRKEFLISYTLAEYLKNPQIDKNSLYTNVLKIICIKNKNLH